MAEYHERFAAVHGRGDSEDADALASRRRKASLSKAGMAEVSLAMGRSHDPMWYWENNNTIFDVKTEKGLERLRAFCREVYQSHPYIPSVIDTYARFPLIQMELRCKDNALAEWYTDLFMDDLNYEDYLVDLLREYWTVGEGFAWGSFNDLMGVWESDELLNPNDVRVVRSPFLAEQRFLMRLPESLRQILNDHAPAWEYRQLTEAYPELRNYARDDDWLPVSNILIQQIKFSGNPFHPRGLPILLRAMRALIQEEMLNSAQDAIADRLYTPLLLAKIGASASDLGTDQPWVPGQSELRDFEEAFDTALAADFRLLTTHFATSLESVLGRETMPDFTADFDRMLERELAVFGMSKTLLTGADAGETYAADALQKDLMSNLLIKAQRLIGRFFRSRMEVVAEAQEHYDYTMKGGRRIPVMEEVLDIDPETGEQRIVEQPKLLIPDIHFRAMNMKEDENLHQFLETLAAAGAPISYKSRFTNLPVNIEEEAEMKADEDVRLAKLNQETRKRIYTELKNNGLPIPADLKADFDPPAAGKDPQQDSDAAHTYTKGEPPPPMLGTTPLAPSDTLAPTPKDYETQGEADTKPADPATNKLPRNRLNDPDDQYRHRPPESDEQRADMPKASHLASLGDDPLPGLEDQSLAVQYGDSTPSRGIGRLGAGPSHVGKRRLRVQAAHQRINPDPTQAPYDDEAPTLADDRVVEAMMDQWVTDPFLGAPDTHPIETPDPDPDHHHVS